MKTNRFIGLLAMAMLAGIPAGAKVTHILPRPQQVTESAGSFSLGGAANLTDPTGCELLSEFLTQNGTGGKPVTVKLVSQIDGAYDYDLHGYDNEAYRLTVTPQDITIEAVTATGVLRATQTLVQMAEEADGALEAVTITDWPAFKLRGFMHDVGRSFITADEIINQIELYSRFKVNTFHWHLTENQAWRFEVKAYPQLTSTASMTRFAGKYYTQDDCRRVMAAAKKHGVVVIPEIDMPGHSEAFERAMGYEMQTTQGKEVLKKVLEEVADVFADAPYIHIGADEKTITDSQFLPTVTAKVHELGKKVVCWNPIRGVTINASAGFDMTQMWSTSGSKVAGIPNIDCRYNYTNHFDVFADLVGIYKSSIYYVERGNAEVAGTISCPWNDRMTPTQEDIICQNNTFANTLASAERAWIGGGEAYIEQGGTTLPNSGAEFEEFADWERRFLFHKAHSLSKEPIPYVKQTNVRWLITDPFPNSGDASATFPPESEGPASEYTYNGNTYGARMATGAAVYLRHTWGSIIPTFYGQDYSTGNTAYAFTYIYSPDDRQAGALIEFQNYGRSENDSAPENGKWDRKGSRLWLNDEEILPDAWSNAGKSINSEVPLGNENFTARDPKIISLKQGWNKVMIKLPYVAANGVRLNKWLFTFVVTDTEGRDAMSDLIYSPTQSMNPDDDLRPALVAEIKAWLSDNFADVPGYLAPTEASKALAAMLDDESASISELTNALTAAKESVAGAAINQPKPEVYYNLYTPLRESRYLTSGGAGQGVTGTATVSGESSQWSFEARTDGTFNIVNRADGSYLSPTASYNTQVSTTAAAPSAGWTVKAADAVGYAIITSGSVQLNQTTSGLGYKVYNWGNGTELSDAGCKYRFVVAEAPEPVEIPEPAVMVLNITLDGQTPYRVDDEKAAPILASTASSSVAIDCTPDATPEVAVYAAASTTTAERWFSFAMLDGNRVGPRYIGLQNSTEGWYTQPASVSERHRVVMVADAEGYHLYLNGALLRNIAASDLGQYGLSHFGAVEGADALWLGGLATASEQCKYPLTGTIHSARFWTEPLTAAQVAALDYDNLKEPETMLDAIDSASAITVMAGRGTVTVYGTSAPVRVYSTAGRLLATGRGTVNVPAGLAIVVVDGHTFKALIH